MDNSDIQPLKNDEFQIIDLYLWQEQKRKEEQIESLVDQFLISLHQLIMLISTYVKHFW